MVVKTKYLSAKIRSCSNGWEVFPSTQPFTSNDSYMTECFVFEAWEHMAEWLKEKSRGQLGSAPFGRLTVLDGG